LSGVVWYRFLARIPSAVGQNGSDASPISTHGQTGPEASLQSTDSNGSTFTAGFQYVANEYAALGHWQIWAPSISTTAPWADLTSARSLDATPLTPDLWYEITIGADYAARRYIGFRVRIADGPFVVYLSASQLADYHIAAEQKGFGAGTRATLEAENRHNGCTAKNPEGDNNAYTYELDYDDVLVCVAQ
jgi:hypothetical protein